MSLSTTIKSIIGIILATSLIEIALPNHADARAGSGRSSGRSSGFSRQSAPRQQYAPHQQQPYAPTYNTPRQGGGFMRGLAGGVAGGFLGSMLFSSMGNAAGGGGGGGGGIGLFDLILLGGVAFLAFRWWKSRQDQPAFASATDFGGPNLSRPTWSPMAALPAAVAIDTDTASEIFFQVQAAWTRRELHSATDVLSLEMMETLGRDMAELKRLKQINRLENISIRHVEVVESAKEGVNDLSTVKFTANLLDYTVDEVSGNVVDGSNTVPVKFEENWTFERATASGWKLVGISQM